MRKIRKFDEITKECEWCQDDFTVAWKYRKQRFCHKSCMYEWRKDQNWEDLTCLHCGDPFKARKKDKRMFCSDICHKTSEYRKQVLKKEYADGNNAFNKSYIDKIKQTKLEKYGDANYNNSEKMKRTTFERYGTNVSFFRKSNGKRISKMQREVYKYVKNKHKKTKLEFTLPDVLISVDIYIPNKNLIIETNGDYWHMNPNKYKSSDFNKSTKKTAKQHWAYDKARQKKLTDAGYNLIVLWEDEIDSGDYYNILEGAFL